MKQIVDNETGEIIEVEETFELVEKELNEVGVNYEEYFDKQIQLKTLKEQMEIWEQKNRDIVQMIFEKYNIKSLKTEFGTISYIPESIQKKVDTERLKEAGLYEKYLKLTPVKAHLMIKAKENKYGE